MLLDAHCHIDRYPSLAQVLREATDAGVSTIAVTELPSAYQRLSMLLGSRPQVHVALGVHPLRAASASTVELRLFDRLVDQTAWVGEVGLDFSRAGVATRDRQMAVFERVLGHPKIDRKVLSVHSRGAEGETVAMLAETRLTAVLHWYSGPLRALDDALAAGLYFSVNPAMLASKTGMRVIGALPHDRVLVETDGPHTRIGSKVARPADVPRIVRDLAGAWGVPYDEAQARLAENATALLASVKAGRRPDARHRVRTSGRTPADVAPAQSSLAV